MISLDDKFRKYHQDNPGIFGLFIRFTREARRRGYRHFGSKAVFERIRWHMNVETTGDPFKINNNYTSRYVRLLEKEYPGFVGFYRQRQLKAV